MGFNNWELPNIDVAGAKNQYQAVNRVLKHWGAWIAVSMLKVFAETAARFTPPNMGKANIADKYYYRPVQELTKLAKGEYSPYHATKQDYAMLRQGYKFRVLNTKQGHKKNEVYAYTRGINEAKRVSRIQNRGLARYTWGDAIVNAKLQNLKDLNAPVEGKSFDTNLPPIFHRLVKKSPNISKYHFGRAKATWNTGKNAFFNIEVINTLSQSERYCQIAIERGTIAVDKWSNNFFGKVKSKIEKDVKNIIEETTISNKPE